MICSRNIMNIYGVMLALWASIFLLLSPMAAGQHQECDSDDELSMLRMNRDPTKVTKVAVQHSSAAKKTHKHAAMLDVLQKGTEHGARKASKAKLPEPTKKTTDTVKADQRNVVATNTRAVHSKTKNAKSTERTTHAHFAPNSSGSSRSLLSSRTGTCDSGFECLAGDAVGDAECELESGVVGCEGNKDSKGDDCHCVHVHRRRSSLGTAHCGSGEECLAGTIPGNAQCELADGINACKGMTTVGGVTCHCITVHRRRRSTTIERLSGGLPDET
eukprot:gnl/TRDRNA2_/TRDRNA2_175274_c0_seq1.p1 gnl/TRDRNA2_/TRDRNA2_175274_c0~~gnl/TRDRNA2_/TRDRNA2_175274_c0_seq1.p1  ORF type:complete len:274 (+),score=35.47 gnl/TRDRNA2_/TRDRNA2_175274_c0_seq1:108-929(+)